MAHKKQSKKTKVRDLKPIKDAKGGVPPGPSNSPKPNVPPGPPI
jgi:hypothetical protein